MDEVDNIIIHSLRGLGCNIDENSITSLSSFTPELLVETISQCFSLINPALDLPKTLPKNNIAQRFQVCSTIAEAVSGLGYRGDIGYQILLYMNNISEVRRVFMFLIERLPKETESISIYQQPLDKVAKLEKAIYQNILELMTEVWLPSWINHRNTNNNLIKFETIKFKPLLTLIAPQQLESVKTEVPQLHNYWIKRSPGIFQQCNSLTLYSTLINNYEIDCYYDQFGNSSNLINRTKSNLKKLLLKYNQPQSITEDFIENILSKDSNNESINEKSNIILNNPNDISLIQSHDPLNDLKNYIEKLKKNIDDLNLKRKLMQNDIGNLKNLKLKQNEKDLQDLYEKKKIKERCSIILENPETNIDKMESLIAAGNERLKKIKLQMEQHRKPLLVMLEKIKMKNNNNQQNQKHLLELKIIREKSGNLREDLKSKANLYSQLLNEYQKIDKNITRNIYTNRLLEIIANIRKQKNDIDKVLRDTRELQKQINNINGQLDRQFTVTDDLLFKTAKHDEYSKKAYKLLATLHSDCSELVNQVTLTGSTMREIREIEEQIDTEKSRNMSLNLEKITYDLKQMQNDSNDIQQKIYKIENESY